MRRVSLEHLKAGDRLGRSIYGGPDALPLLRAGVVVSEAYLRSLNRAGIRAVWVDDAVSEGIEPSDVLHETTRERATTVLREAIREVSRSVSRGATLSVQTTREMHDVAELIVEDVSQNIHSALALTDLANADAYTLKHSLAVTTLGLSLGLRVILKYGWIDTDGKRRFDILEDRLVALGVGLLLHDIGKLAVPEEILRKPGRLNDEEWQTMRAHPLHGVQILRNAPGISPLSRAVVRSHHERWNGAGYPDRQSGEQIHQFARIAAVADVFDAVSSDRCYRQALPMQESYDLILGGSGREFDPEVVDVFKASVAPYPPGTCVMLSDGRVAIVKSVAQGAVTTPIVRLVGEGDGDSPRREVDLARTPDLKIVGAAVPVTAAP